MSITKSEVLKMDYQQVFNAIKNPATQGEMISLMKDKDVALYVQGRIEERNAAFDAKEAELDSKAKTVPPSTDQLAEEAAAVAATPDESVPAPAAAEVVESPKPVVPDYSAEDAAWAVEGVTVSRDAAGKIVRMVQEYQVQDEDGRAIGRPTSLVARSPQELVAKQREAHSQATRAFSRLKKQKLSFKEQEAKRPLTVEEIKAAAAKALEAKSADEAVSVAQSVLDSKLNEKALDIQRQKAEQEGFAITNVFLRNHLHDYYPIEANNKVLIEYFQENQMEYTLPNLEAAFVILMDEEKLVKVPSKNLPETTVAPQPNPAPSAAPAVTPAASSTPATAVATPEVVPAQPQVLSTPVVEATATTPAAPTNSAPAARRPGVNGSIPPGQFSANRPELVDPVQARKTFMKSVRDMDPKILAGKVNPNSPKFDGEFVKTLKSYGIQIK